MKRFILLTFGFLGWAFYEMSGGSEFESASDRQARLNPTPEVTTAAVDETEDQDVRAPASQGASGGDTAGIVTASTEPGAIVDTDPPLGDEVTRVSLNLTSLEAVLQETAADPDPAEPAQPLTPATTAQIVDPETGVPVNTDVSTASADTPAIIPSLVQSDETAATLQPETTTASVGADIRVVSGSRVNVRGGPSTDFGVVTKLTRGAEVEILEDNGDGWVLMRPVDGGPEGWMADFLLVAG